MPKRRPVPFAADSPAGKGRRSTPEPASCEQTELPWFSSLEAVLQVLEVREHLCLICDLAAARRAAALPFLLRGLSRGERCLYLASTHAARHIRESLAESGVDPAAAEASGQLTFADWSTIGGGEGRPAARGLAFLAAAARQPGGSRRRALRAILEMSDCVSMAEDLPELLELEVRLRRDVLARHRCLALCLYDQARTHPALSEAVARIHPFVGRGTTVLRNRSWEAPEEVLARLREGQTGADLWEATPVLQTPPAPRGRGVTPLPRGNETVLLVDCHAAVRRAVAHMLRDLGYTVLEAADTRDIPHVLRAHQGPVDLLVTDIVQDEEDGFLLAHTLADRLSQPGLVLLTACASRSALGAPPPGAREDLLVRAAAMTAVATTVRQVLDARAAERS